MLEDPAPTALESSPEPPPPTDPTETEDTSVTPRDAAAPDDPTTPGLSGHRRPSRRVLFYLLATAAILLGLVVADRRPADRPKAEILDQGGAAALQPADLAQLRRQASDLPYPATIVLNDRPGSRGQWERSLLRLAQPDRLVVGVASGEGWVVVSRGTSLPFSATEERAIQAAAESGLRAGEPARGALLAVAQARVIGDPRPPARTEAVIDAAKLQLALSILAPAMLLLCCLGGIRYRLHSWYS